ncbi:glycosyltransferase [Paenibacillus sp. H1-7]|uniref:glycosyltransferase n=1 Tax=Paenibacillus sp. H1-7 TaxID=2282849 RepID=UPI001EF858CF|nr:glycosyltransferase [Paenibacillus sp. H1-7]ULL13897.1 glycosyltransferase [Paenibacillus sp. H1-7]
MKKKLLFIMPSLTSGGGEKSLVTLLNKIDFDRYDVDLFLLVHEGLFMEYIPPQVRLLPLTDTYRLFSLPLFESFRKLLLGGHGLLACNRLMFSLISRMGSNISRKEQYTWKYLAASLKRLPQSYDVAIGFLENTSTYFCVDKVNAVKKVGWVHIDYEKLGMDPNFDRPYFKKLDSIVTVSEQCAQVLKQRFPEEQHKVEVIYNIVSPSMIHAMAEQVDNIYKKQDDEIVILSVGRLHYQKGFEMAVESCKKLVDRGYNVKWSIIGEGEERGKLTALIEHYRLNDHFHLLGLRSNPYPYIKQADIYVQTSKFEGKSIAIDEAKILNKPILVTNFSTAKDQIEHGRDGWIVAMNADAIADGIEKLIQDNSLRMKLSTNLSRLKLGTEEEIHKFYGLVNG